MPFSILTLSELLPSNEAATDGPEAVINFMRNELFNRMYTLHGNGD